MFVDLYKSDIPWDIVTDDNGKVIGEVFKPLPDPPQNKRKAKLGVISTSLLGSPKKESGG
ncbi:hypothetical protein [Paenibacillus sp. FSL R7-0026]|uniref:hypothetical protein n=1 Tax=Paenibacillus sp. FSL R7-0026 TaxID=2921668 RepID=UPI0030F89B37